MDMDSTWIWIGTAGAVIVGALYWFCYRTPDYEEPPLIIKPPPNFASANKPKKEKSSKEGIPAKLLFYSQTGTAEDFAQRLSEDISSFGFSPEVLDVENFNMEDLENEKFIIFLASTYGEGDPPDNAADFHRWLMDESREQGLLSNLKYSVFGLGNKTYDKFNQIGKDLDKRLESLGGTRLFPLGLGDDDVNIEKDFLSWKKDFGVALCKAFGLDATIKSVSAPSLRRQKLVTYQPKDKAVEGIDVNIISRWRPDEKPRSTPDQKNPYLAEILVTRELHTPKSDRSCLHVEINTHGDILSYNPGDHLGLYPENDPTMVHKLAAQIKADLKSIISVHTMDDVKCTNPLIGPCTLQAALLQYYDISSVVRKPQLRALAQYASSEEEKEKLLQLSSEDPDMQEKYDKFIVTDCRCISDVLKEFPSVQVPLDHFLEVLPKMQPRYYSISSSPHKHPGSVHITVVLVDYITPTKRKAKGVTTRWLSTHRADHEQKIFPRIPAFIRKSTFKMPASSSTPMIMVGPGTGLAPFRGFIQEISYRRSQNKQQAPVVLFFGCRHPDVDYLYKEELEAHLKEGDLTRLIVAFSRELEKKVYVQHKMLEEGVSDELWNLLQQGAYFYVCGDARLMARDVADALLNIVMSKGNKSREEAQKYIDELQKDQRYQSDVWS